MQNEVLKHVNLPVSCLAVSCYNPPMIDGSSRQIVTAPFMGRFPELEIPLKRAEQIRLAFDRLRNLNLIEDRYDLAIANYRSLEEGLLLAALDHLVYDDAPLADSFHISRRFARHLSNLFSSCRMYFDHTPRLLSGAFPDVASLFRDARHASFDSSFEYRLSEGLRNHMQHYSTPFRTTRGSSRVYDADESIFVFHTTLSVVVSELLVDSSLPSGLRRELEALNGDIIPLDDVIRTYMFHVSEIHHAVREATKSLFAEDTDTIRTIFEEYEELFPELRKVTHRSLLVCTWPAGALVPESHWELNDVVVEIIEVLRRRNQRLEGLPRSYVTGMPAKQIRQWQQRSFRESSGR